VSDELDPCLASVDGEIMLAAEATIPATDEGLIRGDGVFEVMRVYEGVPFALQQHFARLQRSARNMRLPLDLEAVRADTHRLLARAGTGPNHQLVRIVITRGGRRLLLTESMHLLPPRARVGTITYSPTRILDGVKSLSYGANMLAGRLVREQGYDEALLVTPHGRVLEAPTSAMFWIKDGEVFTPPLSDHILASITRWFVIDVTGAQERVTTLKDLRAADEVFLASTVREVQQVASIDDHVFPVQSPVSARIAQAVGERIRSELAAAASSPA
jgi:branched-chain amino acid aminotransferase